MDKLPAEILFEFGNYVIMLRLSKCMNLLLTSYHKSIGERSPFYEYISVEKKNDLMKILLHHYERKWYKPSKPILNLGIDKWSYSKLTSKKCRLRVECPITGNQRWRVVKKEGKKFLRLKL